MNSKNYTLSRLTLKEFDLLSTFIYENFGIKMPPVKKTLLECRLQKRLRDLKIDTFEEYIKYLFRKEGNEDELMMMANVVTTNKTDFFREPAHFEFIRNIDWNAFLGGDARGKVLQAWSAGCSSGEEAYTLAMVLSELKQADYRILATDLSHDILSKAVAAIYATDKTQPIPLHYKQKYFLKHKDPQKPILRVAPEIRKKVNFQHMNFMDPHFEVSAKMDLIFCRNVLIYFDRPTQEKVIRKLCMHLRRGGYLFIGHSESLADLNLPLTQVKSTIFQKR